MAKILVYNNNTNRMETYYRSENQRMPYNNNSTLTVRELGIVLDIYMADQFMLVMLLKGHGKVVMEHFLNIMPDLLLMWDKI